MDEAAYDEWLRNRLKDSLENRGSSRPAREFLSQVEPTFPVI